MKDFFDFVLILIQLGFPYFALILIIAVAVWLMLPIRLNLSIGDRSDQNAEGPRSLCHAAPARLSRRTRF